MNLLKKHTGKRTCAIGIDPTPPPWVFLPSHERKRRARLLVLMEHEGSLRIELVSSRRSITA